MIDCEKDSSLGSEWRWVIELIGFKIDCQSSWQWQGGINPKKLYVIPEAAGQLSETMIEAIRNPGELWVLNAEFYDRREHGEHRDERQPLTYKHNVIPEAASQSSETMIEAIRNPGELWVLKSEFWMPIFITASITKSKNEWIQFRISS